MLATWLMPAAAAISQPSSPPEQASNVRRFEIRSDYLGQPSVIDVLLPDHYDPAVAHRVLFVLPVEAGTDFKHFGNGLERMRSLNVHNDHNLIVVRPTFDHASWGADHATDASRRHERHLVEVVVPFVDEQFSTTGSKEGRLLVGYSKSGWAAISLVFRHPDVFGYAAAWDVPAAIQFGMFATDAVFGTPEQFDLFSPLKLAENPPRDLTERRRIALLGATLFGTWSNRGSGNPDVDDTLALHEAFVRHGVQHLFSHEMNAQHHWDGDWVLPAVEAVVALASAPSGGDAVFSCDFEAPFAPPLTAATLNRATAAGAWVANAAWQSRLVADASGTDHALLPVTKGGKAYAFTMVASRQVPLSERPVLRFKTVLRSGFGKAGAGYGGDRNHIIEVRDAMSRPLLRLILIGDGDGGRIGYLPADAAGTRSFDAVIFDAEVGQNPTDVHRPEVMKAFRLELDEEGFAVFMDDQPLGERLPYLPNASPIVSDIYIHNTQYAAQAFFDDIELAVGAPTRLRGE